VRSVVLALSATVLLMGCESDALTAPSIVPTESNAVAAVAVDAPAPRILSCRRPSVPTERLFVVDGNVVEPDAIQRLDPRTIVSVEVLKGAAASALYGSRASVGAVLITTRSALPPATR